MENAEKCLFGIKCGHGSLGAKVSLLVSFLYYSQHPFANRNILNIPALVSTEDARIILGSLMVIWNWTSEFYKPSNPFQIWEDFFDQFVVRNSKHLHFEFEEDKTKSD